MRSFVVLGLLALLGFAAGCGDDTTQATGADLSVPRTDLSGQAASCSAAGVAQSCANASGNSGCFVCALSGLSGTCARVCSLLGVDCPTGQTCHEFSVADGGTASGIAVEGTGCSGFGYCH